MSQLLDDQTQGSINVTKDHSDIINSIFNSGVVVTATVQPPLSSKDSISNSGIDASATSPLPSVAQIRIPKVPTMVCQSQAKDYDKYYVPKVVSIGPYHFWNKNLKAVQNLKPRFTMKLLSNDKDTLTSLYNKLCEPQMVQELRNFYEENSTTKFSDMDFAKMMLLDGCFILYYIEYIFGGKPENYPELKTSQIKFAHQDLLLLENQIPYEVLIEVTKLIKTRVSLQRLVESFIYDSSIVTPVWPKMKRLIRINKFRFDACYHLLHVLHCFLINNKVEAPKDYDFFSNGDWCSFRNASELADVGIHFKPSDSMLLSSVKFSKGWLKFSANVKLPRIKVNGSTKHLLLNLIAYESSSLHGNKDAWVTSYVCLLDSLIDHPEDVKVLRKAWVLETSLGSDKEVAKLFNEIASELVPNNSAYMETKYKIQMHYGSGRNVLFSQLKNEYFRSPWAVFVLLGALLGLFLSAAQTYSSLTDQCDGLCKSLKKNHHL